MATREKQKCGCSFAQAWTGEVRNNVLIKAPNYNPYIFAISKIFQEKYSSTYIYL